MTEIKSLSQNEIQTIYQKYLLKDFPENERRPLKNILALYRQNRYIGWGFYQNDVLCGYAFIYQSNDIFLLDYFAIIPSHRQLGLGRSFLEQLLVKYKNKTLFLEAENPITDPHPTKERRIRFYLKAGLVIQETSIYLYGVDYLLLANRFMNPLDLETFYHRLYPQPIYERYIRFQKNNGK